jgi:hypothetical protein
MIRVQIVEESYLQLSQFDDLVDGVSVDSLLHVGPDRTQLHSRSGKQILRPGGVVGLLPISANEKIKAWKKCDAHLRSHPSDGNGNRFHHIDAMKECGFIRSKPSLCSV